jgi:hypothetical protein
MEQNYVLSLPKKNYRSLPEQKKYFSTHPCINLTSGVHVCPRLKQKYLALPLIKVSGNFKSSVHITYNLLKIVPWTVKQFPYKLFEVLLLLEHNSCTSLFDQHHPLSIPLHATTKI